MERRDFTFYGAAKEFTAYHGPEAIIHGPAETGKTISCLWKLHLCALKYPGASIVIARKVLNDIYGSVWETYYRKVIGDFALWPCQPYGGTDRPSKVNYDNGSTLWFAGFDRPGKVLSSEKDIIYINQAEETELEDWETATTRTTGRAGNMPYSQTIGDANPAWPMRWMYHRDTLRLFESKHVDNPTLYQNGVLTEQGLRTMAVLHALTGVRRDRLLLGIPALAEGAIYTEYMPSHRRYAKDAPRFFRYVAGVDWGYRNPGAMGVFGLTGDGAMWLVAQYYRIGKRDDWWLEKALELDEEFDIEAFACDPSEPAYIDKFCDAGLNAIGAFNAVIPGINAVKKRLTESRLLFLRDSLREPDPQLARDKRPLRVEDEFPGYVWAGKGKEKPVKENDHGLDFTRYATAYVDRLGQKQKKVVRSLR